MSEASEYAALLDLSRDDLKALWRAEISPTVPKHIRRHTMAIVLINERQWAASGQSRERYRKRLKRLIDAAHASKPQALIGNRLVREWHGREHVVDVLPEGYLWNGKTWRSLSAIAKEITGTKWSGPRFFGVAA